LDKQVVLLTGGTGFLGKIFREELRLQYALFTLGRSSQNDISIDLSVDLPVFTQKFDLVVHNAGKAHTIPKTAREADAFWALNHQGTLRLLAALEHTGYFPQCFVYISTVAVYGVEAGINIDETSPLLAKTPYAQSKLAAERAIQAWGLQHGVPTVILRLPLVVGPNPPGNLAKIAKAIQKGRYVRIQHNNAQKSAVLGTDVARLIGTLQGKSGTYNLTDGVHPTFESIEYAISAALKRPIRWSVPKGLLHLAASIGDYLPGFPLKSPVFHKLTSSLTFNDALARKNLGWKPNPVLPLLADHATWV
jgi:nucleoside-diphosphate-sugar epimerase